MERKYVIYHNGIKVDVVEAKADTTIVMAVFDGVTRQSGLTGYETYLHQDEIKEVLK